jgi:hypothetical protein
MGIFSATLPKASLVAFVLWPDLPMIGTGFLGLLLGLVFLEYLRLILETVVCGISARGFLVYRVLVFGSLVAVVGFGLSHAVSVVTLDGKNHWQFLSMWARAIGSLNDSVIGQNLVGACELFGWRIGARRFGGAFFDPLRRRQFRQNSGSGIVLVP